jgi:hypothetical protein
VNVKTKVQKPHIKGMIHYEPIPSKLDFRKVILNHKTNTTAGIPLESPDMTPCFKN